MTCRRPQNGLQAGASSRRARATAIAIALALAALVLAIYAPVRHFDFVQLDDPAYITENPHVLRGLTLDGVRWAFTTGHAANWHPLTWLSHMLDAELFGIAPGPHHLTSVLLHALNTLLLFGALLRMTGAVWRSAVVAALFGVHPLRAESVAWVAERKDVLSALFWLLTLRAYAGFAAPAEPAAPRRRRRYALALALFALGLMAKPMLVTLPFTLLLLDWWPLGRLGRTGAWPLVREKIPFVALAAASSAVTLIVQERGGAVSAVSSEPFALRLENAVVSLVAYLRDMLWPAGLTVIYPFPESVPAWQASGACLVLGGISLAAWRLARSHPYVPVGWLWYLGTLLPVAGLVRVGLQARADRYTYVPLIGIFIAVVWGGAELAARAGVRFPRRPALPAVAPALLAAASILALAAAARHQVGYWKDNVTLWTRATVLTLRVDEFEAHMSLGAALAAQGRSGEALRHFAEAVRLRPDSAEARRAEYDLRRQTGGAGVPR